MADVTVYGTDYQALPRKYRDQGDGTYAEVVFNGSGAGASIWTGGGMIAAPSWLSSADSTLTLTSGTQYLAGGPGMVVPAGITVAYIKFMSNGAAVAPTHQYFFLAIPDEDGNDQATVVATSLDDLTTPWGANVVKKLSLAAGDGGSGVWTPTVDTPVYGGIVQIAGTPATIRGGAPSQVTTLLGTSWWGSGPGGLVGGPQNLPGTFAISGSAAYPASTLWSS